MVDTTRKKQKQKMKKQNHKILLITFFIVIIFVCLVGCSKKEANQPTGPASIGNNSIELNGSETIDPDELSDYVDEYIINIQEDENVNIN